MGRDIIELDGVRALNGLPPRIQKLMRARQLAEKRTGRRDPFGGSCAVCSKYNERIFPSEIECCQQCLDRFLRHGKVNFIRKHYNWQRNPLTWAKLKCGVCGGNELMLFEVQIFNCYSCSKKISRWLKRGR